MKSYNKFCIGIFSLILLLFVFANICLYRYNAQEHGRPYRVEAGRAAAYIESYGLDNLDLSQYDYITAVYPQQADSTEGFFDASGDYIIRDINGTLYRIEYTASGSQSDTRLILTVNLLLFIMAAAVFGVLLFIRVKILKPFCELREVPYELSKGNLTVPVKEDKNSFFGRFVWGIDLLRENLEQQKRHELQLQKEKKTLLLSLSHDIKTPLSAIKLYAKAISKNLYQDRKKQIEIAENINQKADEIEGFVSDIIKASKEDFLNLEVNVQEFYLSQVMEKITEYYTEKLSLAKIPFAAEEFSDCLLKGDSDRVTEVLQNIMENAVKYGDGHEIGIMFSEEEDCRLITVKNSGCTLSESELPHIFDSFYRGSNTGNAAGSGLGLYIAKQLMHKMDGEVFAHMENGYMLVTVVIRKS